MRPRGKGTGHGARMISEQTLCLTFLSCEWGKPCLPLGTIGDIRGVPACEGIYLEGAWHTLSMQEMLTITALLVLAFLLSDARTSWPRALPSWLRKRDFIGIASFE